jgi:hypothetical protein
MDYNPLAPEVQESPYSYYASLRQASSGGVDARCSFAHCKACHSDSPHRIIAVNVMAQGPIIIRRDFDKDLV